MIARPREFDNDKVLDALRDVFWQHGYDGTSYADIMAATGLQKGSLYAAFGDKRALYEIALARYDDAQVSQAVALLGDMMILPKARIKAMFDSLIIAAETPQGRWGCLLCNASVDQAPREADVEQAVQNGINRIKSSIASCVKGTSAAKSTELIWASYFGGQILVKAGCKKATLKNLQKQILALF